MINIHNIKKHLLKILKKYLIYTSLKILLIVIFISLKKEKSIEYKKKFYELFVYLLIKKKYIVINKQLIKKNNNSKKGIIIISNHVNIYDHIFIRNTIDCYAVANEAYILSNKIKKNFQIIPYKIFDKKSGDVVKKNILELINSGKNVLVFPEGRMCNSFKNNLLKFREGLFHLAYDNDIPILMTMLYSNNNKIAVGHPVASIRVIINILSNIFLFDNKNSVIIYELINFVYKKNFKNFNDYYEYIYKTMNTNLKKYVE